MQTTYQYKMYPDTKQRLSLNEWLRICRYWYNRQLGDRFDWWSMNRSSINACPLVSSIAPVREKPNYYTQKKQLPIIKKDLVKVFHRGELLDFLGVDSTILQDVSKRVDKAFERFVMGDSNGCKSGKPRFKSEASFRTMTFATANNSWIKLTRKNWLYLRLPKLGVVKVRMHRPIPDGFIVKQVSVTKKADGWFIQFVLEDVKVPIQCQDIIVPAWDNSLGLDAVLHKDVYLATSDGEKLSSFKPLRKNQASLDRISTKRNKRKRGSKSRRKLAKREARQHQRIARSRKDFHYKTAHKLVRTGKKVFFHEDLNLKGLTKRNKSKQAENGTFLPNGQSAKSGLNKSWSDAAFGNFFTTLDYIASKAGAVVIAKNPAYTSMVLCYRDEIIFTDCSIRDYWDEQESLMVDRDINAAINLKRLGLDIFPSIKRRSGKLSIVGTLDKSTAKEILHTLHRAAKKPTS
ncbi:transposase [Lyngbya sp. CCAP 1446/10]|uniref:RNA-guided endonuclease InsQ/TnpB family protein n=1 Tax=Lyngbya sp. CCAP 1446/10 TaxID=439293 RepID=UPI00223883C6|nr:transposase [Lyngbya sp. CCAP 1446/10]MCW6051341.1 transposase [Lyngbya sp. CCAP 1446/10]